MACINTHSFKWRLAPLPPIQVWMGCILVVHAVFPSYGWVTWLSYLCFQWFGDGTMDDSRGGNPATLPTTAIPWTRSIPSCGGIE